MYGVNEKVFIAGLFILFVTVVLGGVFSSQVAVLWIRNKREQRKHEDRNREKDRLDQYEAERAAWVSVINEKDRVIVHLSEELRKQTRELEQAKQIMSKVNLKGDQI